ncbi:TolB family protein [Candidatus Oscillochloris fontis]|uniref:TolB family protein n=1 Tax=Candidatus Oscillochloris fontis TaxID=2496868 RepID=UPI00137628AC|nr:PD40 domain-containing protein [Candidatus Oscillochloris fontis]
MQSPQNGKSNTHLWAGTSNLSAKDDPFPWRDFFYWFRIGFIGLVVLFLIFTWLEWRASKQIIYLTDGSLGVIRADGTEPRPLRISGLNGSFGPPQWSPRGGRFATIVEKPSGTTLLIAKSNGQSEFQVMLPPTSILPDRAWAPSGNYVAVMSSNSGDSELHIVDIAQNRVNTISLALAIPQVIWHPKRDEVLVTERSPEDIWSLQIVTPDAKIREFAPNDQFTHRSEGVWSPDGQRIAYIGTSTIDDTVRVLMTANIDGSTLIKVLVTGNNFFPIWSPRGDLLLFTQVDPNTNVSTLYRVKPNGEQLQIIGRGLPRDIIATDVSHAVSWSPDRSRMFFQSFSSSTGEVALSIANYDGSNSKVLFSDRGRYVPLTALWSPTSRGILIVDEGTMRMRWFSNETAQKFTWGEYPSWEP